jgi:hypothetical protein
MNFYQSKHKKEFWQWIVKHEKLGNIQRAMKLFAKAGKSDSAAHLAMKHGIDKELLSLALQVYYC